MAGRIAAEVEEGFVPAAGAAVVGTGAFALERGVVADAAEVMRAVDAASPILFMHCIDGQLLQSPVKYAQV